MPGFAALYWMTPFGSELTLRHERSGDRGDREQQQQEQRGAHARELAPEEPQVADDAELRLRRSVVGSASMWSDGRSTDVRLRGRCAKPPITAPRFDMSDAPDARSP